MKKNAKLFAEDILAENHWLKEEDEMKKKEKEMEKEKRENERKRKREDEEKKKMESFQLHEDRKAKKARELEEKERDRITNTCKAGCNHIWRTSDWWQGCNYCDDFWMCPACFCVAPNQRQMEMHE